MAMTDGGHLFNNFLIGGRGGTDEDFVADKDDGGLLTHDSDGSDSGGEKEKPVNKEVRKESSSSKSSSPMKRSRDGNDEGKKKKPKKKKDPNAPKRAMSGPMFFAKMEIENIKNSNPGIAFMDVGRVLGDKWKAMSAEEKEQYEAISSADKKRYREEMTRYENSQNTDMDSGVESD